MTLKPRDPGIYFNLPSEEYHADPSLSFTGIKWLMLSPLACWWNSPMNPRYEPVTSPALVRGQAYHARILEGEEAFRSRFYRAPQKQDHPDAIDTVSEIRERLKALKVKATAPKGETVKREHLVAALRQADPTAVLWQDRQEQAAKGRTLLPDDEFDAIELTAGLVAAHAEARTIFSEGHPEVSVFWRDEETGVPLRTRFDWWAPEWICELKTFSNPLKQDIDKKLVNAILNEHYRVQCALHMEAARVAPALLTDEQRETWAPDPHPDYVWLFVGTDIPHVRARGFPSLKRDTATGHSSEPEQVQAGRIQLRHAIKTYAACLDVYGTDIWADREGIKKLEDSDFPIWSTDGITPDMEDAA
jgi:hypothetical protein